MLQMAGVPDGYCLRDLLKPERSRIQKNLSAIINLYKCELSGSSGKAAPALAHATAVVRPSVTPLQSRSL
jgi:hypothetical protein